MNSYGRTLAAVSTLGVFALAPTMAAAETKSFVVSLFAPATNSKDGDCSKGINIQVSEQYQLDLLAVGYTREQVDQLMTTAQDTTMFGGATTAWGKAVIYRAKVKGKAVSAWVNPQAALDPNLSMVDGKEAFGFDLDGKGPDQATAFTDPLTGEKGVDNQYFRAMGCFTVFRGTETFTPGSYHQAWTMVQLAQPAWLITFEGKDLSKDGPVKVSFDVASEHVEYDALANVMRDVTFRTSPDPRNHHEFEATLKDGVITNNTPGYIFAALGEEMAFTQVELKKSKFRFQIKPNGDLRGLLGGYQPWKDNLTSGVQANMGTDWVGVYYNLRKSADSNPDPVSGINQDISTAFFIDAVPAYVMDPQKARKTSSR